MSTTVLYVQLFLPFLPSLLYFSVFERLPLKHADTRSDRYMYNMYVCKYIPRTLIFHFRNIARRRVYLLGLASQPTRVKLIGQSSAPVAVYDL